MNEEGNTKVTGLEEYNTFQSTPKSSVKLKKNHKNILTWEIKICTGEEDLIDGLMEKAVEVHKELEKEFE